MKNLCSQDLSHMKRDIHRYVQSTKPSLRDFCELRYSRNNTQISVNCQLSMYFQCIFNVFSDLNTQKAYKDRELLIDNRVFWKANLKMYVSNGQKDTCPSLRVAFQSVQPVSRLNDILEVDINRYVLSTSIGESRYRQINKGYHISRKEQVIFRNSSSK